MGDLNRIRAAFPDLDKYNYSDSEVINWMAGRLGQDPRELGVEYGVIDPDQGDLSRGFEAGVDSTKALVSGAVGIAGDTLGFEGMRDAGIRGYQRNMADIGLNSRPTDNAENVDSLGDAADFAQYYLGYAAPQIAEAALSGGIGSILGKQVVKQGVKRQVGSEVAERALRRETGQNLLETAGRRGGLAAMGTQAVGTETGAIYGDAAQRAIDEGRSLDSVDTGRVALGGLAAGALEFGADVATLGLARVGPAKSALDLLNTRSRTANAAIRGTTGAVTEGTTEVLQTGIEEVGAGTPLAEANFSDPTAFFAGAVGGGAIGGAGGLISPTPSGSDIDTQEAQLRAEEDAQLEAQALAEEKEAAEQAQAEVRELGRIRRRAAATFTPQEAFEAERVKVISAQMKAQTAQLEQDALNPETEIGQSFEAVLNEKGVFDPAKVAAEAKAFVEGYQNPDKVSADARKAQIKAQAEQEYIAALDMHAEAVARGEVTAPQVDQDAEGDTATDAASQENVTAPAKKPTKKEQLRADAVEKLGEDFEQNYPELSQLLSDGKGIHSRGKNKKSRFESMLDKAVAEQNTEAQPDAAQAQQPSVEAEQTATPAAQEGTEATQPSGAAFLDDSEVRAELKPQQQKVYDAVLKAANDNTLGDLFSVTFESGDATTQSEPEANTPTSSSAIKARRAAQRKILKDAGVKEKTILSVFKTKTAKPSAEDVSKYASVGGITSQAQPLRQAEQVNILEADGVPSDVITLFKEAAAKKPEKKAPKERGFKVEANNALLKSLSGISNQQSAATATSAVVSKLREKYGNDGLREMLIQSGVSMSGGVEVADTATANDLLAEGGAATGTISSAGGSQSAGAASKARAKAAEVKLMKAAGMTAEDIKSFYAVESTVPELADADGDAAVRAAEEASLGALSGILAQSWDSSASRRNAPLFDDLTTDQKLEWMHYSNAADASSASDRFDVLDRQQREIERAATSGTETQNEQVSEPQTEERNEEKRDTSVAGSASGGGSLETVPNADAGSTPQGASSQENVDTGVVGGAKTAPVVEVKKRKKIDPKKAKMSNPRFGVRDNATATASREVFEQSVNELTGDTQNVRIHVFDNEADALAAVENGDVPSADVDEIAKVQPYGWVQEDENGVPHAHFILDRIPAGGERAAFMHEVGGHVGIDNVLDEASRTKLASQIAGWAEANDGSLESKLALSTLRRMDFAAMRGGVSDGVVVSEAIAYFLEEATLAGVDPTAGDAIGNFVQRIYDAFKAAFEALGLRNTDTLVAQDIVDMAYGAARFELMEGSPDPTTTTAPFQRPSYGVNRNQETRIEATRAHVKKNLGAGAVQFLDDASFVARNAVDSTKFLHQFIRENKETMPSAGRWYNASLEAQKTKNDILRGVEAVAVQNRSFSPEQLDQVHDFVSSSTIFGQWGYDPEIDGKTVTVDPTMKRKFDRLSAEQQNYVKNMFSHGEAMKARLSDLGKKFNIDGKLFTGAVLDGPYAPLKRFGGHVATLKSQELLDAERDVSENRTSKNSKKVETLKADGTQYVVKFFDTPGAAQRFVESKGKDFAYAVSSPKKPNTDADRVSNPEVFNKILGQLAADDKSGLDSESKAAFAEMIKKLYFQSQDDRSAVQSNARRMKIAGFDKDMTRAFLSHARAQAALIANMEHGAEINTALADADSEARANETQLRSVYNMIAKHQADTLAGKETPVQDRVAAMNSVYMLTTSVGYHVTNATQPMMVTIPRLAGDFKNYSGAWGALAKGYKVSIGATRMSANFEADIDVQKAPPKYRKLLEDLQLRQLLDVGMEEDLSTFDRFNTGYEPLNRVTDALGKIVHKLYQVARYVEAHNRISAAVAAYDMALANPEATKRLKMTPEEYATAVVEDTQGNFSRFDAPYLIKALPKMTTQYRKYQLMMGWAYGNAFNQAFVDKSISPEEKAMGKRVLGYTLAHAGIFAGVTGVPLVTTLAPYALGWIEGEDEPQDLERWIRENVDNERLADVLSRGVFSSVGVDMSTKLSQGKIFHPFPYVDFEASEDGVRDIFFNAIAGPSGTTALNFGRAAEYAGQGDLMKATEYAVPKGLRTMIESYRLGTEGFSAKNGDVLVDPREFDMQSLLLNALGIPSTDVQKFKWTRGQQFELSQYVSNESSRIRREYIRAKDDGDRARMTELRGEWKDLQDQKERIRPFFGNSREMRRQPLSDLIKAPRRQDRREQRAQRRFE